MVVLLFVLLEVVRMLVALCLLPPFWIQDRQSQGYSFKIHLFNSILQLGKGPETASCSFENGFIMDGVLRYPAASLEIILRSRCKLWGWEGIPFWDCVTAFYLLWGGRFDLTGCYSGVKQIFFREAYEESFLCVHCFILFACLLLSFISYINQHLWELWLPSLPHAHSEESLQAVISKAGLGYLWECHSLVIHWKVRHLCGARTGLKLAELCQARFGYQCLITNEHRWGWLRWEVLALFWGTSEQEFQEHWLFVLLWCKKSNDGLSLMSASDVFPTWRCSLHLTLYRSVLNSNIWGPVT